MKTETRKLKGLFAPLLSLLFVSTACLDEKLDTGGMENETEKSVIFSLTLPGQTAGRSTYALTTTDEEAVTGVEVLLFVSGKYTQSRTVTAPEISGTDNKKTFTVKIPEGTYSSIMLLTNSADIVANAALTKSDTKESAQAKLKLTNSGKWLTTTSAAGYRHIPMWGELGNTVVNQATSTDSQAAPWAINLTRMLAKVSVTLTTQEAIDQLQLKSIQVYNYYNEGSVAPTDANWELDVATKASVPTGATKPVENSSSTSLNYFGPEISTPNVASTGEIYLFESDNAKQTDSSKRTCLVLGGIYAGDAKTYYYRVDFLANKNGTDTYLDLLRNHHYKFNVSRISGPGYKTPDEAFSARPFNIEATVVIWNDTEVKNISTDGQYMLGLSQMEYDLLIDSYGATDSDNQLTIITDYPGGWNISSIIDNETKSKPTWLSVATDNLNGLPNIKKSIPLIVDTNNSGALRTATLSVTAGTITARVQVNQSIESSLMLAITNLDGKSFSQLIFPSGLEADKPILATEFLVKWAPKSATNNVTVSPSFTSAVMFPFDAVGDEITSGTINDPNGTKLYSILPPAMTTLEIDANPFLEKASEVKFLVMNGTSFEQKSIFLRQVNYALKTDENSIYLLDGTTYSFVVKSNADWYIDSVTEEVTAGTGPLLELVSTDNLRKGTTGGNNTTTGDNITFTVRNSLSFLAGNVSVVIRSKDSPKKFSDVTVKLNMIGEYYPPLHQGWAGSNIYWNGSKLTFDDVNVSTNDKYQGVFFQWGSLTGISPSGNYSAATLYLPDGSTSNGTNIEWTAIPRVENKDITSNPPSGKSASERSYLYELDTANGNGTGDICKYLTEQAGGTLHGKRWRMPTAYEFAVSGTKDKVGTLNGNLNTEKQDGRYSISTGYYINSSTEFFPAGGFRTNSGALNYVGTIGCNWSGTPSLGTKNPSVNVSALYFNSAWINTAFDFNRAQGVPVRCVVE